LDPFNFRHEIKDVILLLLSLFRMIALNVIIIIIIIIANIRIYCYYTNYTREKMILQCFEKKFEGEMKMIDINEK